MSRPSVQFESLTHTFSADTEFFDALMSGPSGEAFAEMCLWYTWLREYLNDIQESLADAGQVHGDTYNTWLVCMLAGMGHAIGMLMYLSARGIIHEAGASGRRALEFLGVASHLITNPSKVQFLFDGCEKSPLFRKAFLSGPEKEAKQLKDRGTKFRFAALENAKACTQLWEMFSRFNVHGDSLAVVASIPSLVPTQHSCLFFNRSVGASAKEMELFKTVPGIIAAELAYLAARFGTRTERVNEAGRLASIWLKRQDCWSEALEHMRARLGLMPISMPPN